MYNNFPPIARFLVKSASLLLPAVDDERSTQLPPEGELDVLRLIGAQTDHVLIAQVGSA